MGAFSDALDIGSPPADEPQSGPLKRVYIYPNRDAPKVSPFKAALDVGADPTAPGASFDDRFNALPPKDDWSWSNAITDIPKEIKGAAGHAIEGITNLSKRGEQGPLEGLATTGRAALSVPELIASPLTGAARSLIGHTMANAEHRAGEVIAPDIAAKDNPEAMYNAAKEDTDKAMSAMGPGKVPVAAKLPVPTIDELKASSIKGFHSPEVNDLVLKPQVLQEFGQKSKIELDKLGLDDSVAPVTHRILTKMENAPNGSIVTGRNLVSARRNLQKAAGSADSSERAAATEAIDHLDEHIPNSGKHLISGDLAKASQTLETARGDYTAAMHAETIDKKAIQAELRAASVDSGQNVANKVRQRMADILIKPKEQRGFTKDELGMMEQIVRGSKPQNVVRYAGNLLGGGGGMWAGLLGGGAGYATGGPGAFLPAVGFALKSYSNRMTLQQAAKLSEAIRGRSPLASSAQKLQASVNTMGQGRTAKSVAGVVLASRNFANNLKGIGINIGADDLIRGFLQSPATSNADDQKGVPRPPRQ